MDSFELNKIVGAVLGTCLVLLLSNLAAQAIFAPDRTQKPGYSLAAKEAEPAPAPSKEAEPAAEPIENLLQTASVEKGASVAKKCASCHSFDKDGPNRVGPNLYGIVGEPRGQGRNGFNFTAAMKSKGGNWTFDELDKFLANPKSYIPGTAMGFAGLPNGKERADLIAYLNKNSDQPEPVPTAAK